jgi:LemA protein|tara:strand:- start:1033 stop:1623 length:591 start_codon:yes stop_codon:yes gene_type:complete
MNTNIIVIAVIAVLIIWIISVYNRLVSLRNRYKNSYAQIDVQLKRRYDLIPNLVETAKAYMVHEKDTLDAVIQARNAASSAGNVLADKPGDSDAMTSLIGAESVLTGTMGRLFALAESYPDLKSNQNMMQLTEELSSTENKVAFSRQAYNDAVMTYNTACETFPSMIFSVRLGFDQASLFEIEDTEERANPEVSFT